MSLQLPRLPQTQPNWTQWQVWWEEVATAIEEAEASQQAAIEAIAAAQAAADAANAAAENAQAAAADVTATADAITEANALQSSYIVGAPALAATDAGADATITIGAHTRRYPQPDGTNIDAAVDAGSVTGLAYATLYYLYYDDPARDGGTVTYAATTNEVTAAQTGDRHFVGQVTTPAAAAADTDGYVIRPPGPGQVAF